MRALFWIGLVVLILGIVSLVVPIPRSEREGLTVGGMDRASAVKSAIFLNNVRYGWSTPLLAMRDANKPRKSWPSLSANNRVHVQLGIELTSSGGAPGSKPACCRE